jgi:hypothetical protein
MSEQQYDWSHELTNAGITPAQSPTSLRQAIVQILANVGGTPAGTAVVRKFPFAYNTPGILTGAALYTPTIGDILLDAWVEIDTAWNGTTPFGDVGDFHNGTGLFVSMGFNHPVPMNLADSGIGGGPYLIGGSANDLALWDAIAQIAEYPVPAPVPSSVSIASGQGNANRYVPGKFTTADPVKFCVSQDGSDTGANPGSTQGAAILYLVTATPK